MRLDGGAGRAPASVVCLGRVAPWEKPRCRPTQMPASLLICHRHTEHCQPSAASTRFTPVWSEAGDAVFNSPHTSIQATIALQAPDPPPSLHHTGFKHITIKTQSNEHRHKKTTARQTMTNPTIKCWKHQKRTQNEHKYM